LRERGKGQRQGMMYGYHNQGSALHGIDFCGHTCIVDMLYSVREMQTRVIKTDLRLIRKYVTFSQDKTAISKNQFLTKLVLYMNVISRNCLRRSLVLDKMHNLFLYICFF